MMNFLKKLWNADILNGNSFKIATQLILCREYYFLLQKVKNFVYLKRSPFTFLHLNNQMNNALSSLISSPTKISGVRDLIHKYNNFFFDLDGVIVHSYLTFSGWATTPSRDQFKPSNTSSNKTSEFSTSQTTAQETANKSATSSSGLGSSLN